MKNILLFFLCGLWLIACDKTSSNGAGKNDSPTGTATGDEKAMSLAKLVEESSGGKENWEKIHYISFDYFGSRYWYWDKYKNRYRVESEKRNYRIAGTLDGKKTNLWLRGNIITDPDSLSKYKEHAYRVWINDMYWLILPFKLLDPGVQLHYVGDCVFDSIHQATCIDMTFKNVGVTPNNKYRVYIDTTTNDVIYWDHYHHKNDSLPSLSNPWTDYKQYGSIRLASDRGDERGLEEITLYDQLPDHFFTDVSKSHKELHK